MSTERVEDKNQSSVTEFLLLGFNNIPHLKFMLFVLFLLIYLITILGNVGIMLLIQLDSHLHTPMYFFLSNLSFVDLWCSSTITPKTLINFFTEHKTISYLGCAVQLYFFVVFACTDNFLLAVMAYDRYVAICNPLMYPVIMNRRLCAQLVVCSYLASFLYSLIQTATTFRLSFCRSNVIKHFFCDIPPLLKLSCTDTFINEVVLPILSGIATLPSILTIFISYFSIISTILKIRSAEGRRNAFSTCASHFASVALFYGSTLFMYLGPSSDYAVEQKMLVSAFYTMVIPMLNPLIYSLRNQAVKAALRKIFLQKKNSINRIH
ncbi:olfactory receptor 1020-like [Microcaecilia unicolor]|uniref:Olfactory receptor n=1 Tax=Microcaecilia unicolor TaxID=1415580 RepID=A0A6P7WSJ5_9AMPH|nr:olfactory receptor 1020-like [Microcaecilia unicolor]